jgi:hypothetical protein
LGQLVSELVVAEVNNKTGTNDRRMEGKNKHFPNIFLGVLFQNIEELKTHNSN